MATYKVKKGDTLWAIAQQYGMTVAELSKASGIANPDMIYIGQSITVPEPKKAETPVVSTPTVKQPIPNRNTMTPEEYEVAMDNYSNKIPNAPDPLAYKPLPKAPAPIAPPVVENDYRTTPLVDPYRYGDIAENVKPKSTSTNYEYDWQHNPEADPDRFGMVDEFTPTPAVNATNSVNINNTKDTTVEQDAVNKYLEDIKKKDDAYGDPLDTTYSNNDSGFQYPYKTEIDNLIQQVLNRPKFNYELGNDPQYTALRDQYQTEGNLAMRDTMGNAAGLTGGYGNSYGVTAGSQAYQQSLGQLNKQVPELYRQALNEYTAEGDEMHKTIGALDQQNYRAQSLERDAYGRQIDKQTRDDKLDREAYLDALTERGYTDQQAQQQWENQYKTNIRQDNLNAAALKQQEVPDSPLFSRKDMTTMWAKMRDDFNNGYQKINIGRELIQTYGDDFWDNDGPAWDMYFEDGTWLIDVIRPLIVKEGTDADKATERRVEYIKKGDKVIDPYTGWEYDIASEMIINPNTGVKQRPKKNDTKK